jgi:CRISPR-associated protein Cmr2
MTQQRYMLIFSIGPVQSLIAQARKTRDLWLGSYLLAKLMEAAMEGVEKDIACEFVFPADRKVNGHIPDLPNKYIAIFTSKNDAEDAAKRSKADIKARWESITQQVQERVFHNVWLLTDVVMGIWDRQTNFDTFFEVYWIAEPELTEDELRKERAKPGNEEKMLYQLWLEKAQKSFDARKRLRDFQPQNEPGEKSTVSGEREVLHWHINNRNGSSREATRAYWRRLAGSHPVKDIYHDGSERLDAIDTVKRFALYSDVLQPKKVDGESSENSSEPELIKMDFPSTSSIATASFVKLLLKKLDTEQNKELEAALNKWLELTEKGGFAEMQPHASPCLYQLVENNKERQRILKRDGDCFFDATFVPETLQKMYPDSKINSAEAAQTLKNLRRTVRSSPTPYYALIQMDGDHMGTIINEVNSEVTHKGISEALSTFAREKALDIVEKTDHPGRLVYAGGDDVLAFSPLIGLLKMMNDLQEQYIKIVRPKVPAERQKEVTASMGIAIAHHFTPLSLVRQAAYEAEKLAKNRYGRNALVVTVLRRSGEQTRVGCHWHYDELKPEEQPILLFQEFYQLLINGTLSASSIHTLLDEAAFLVGFTPDAQQSEIKRVLKRKHHSQNDQPDQSKSDLSDEKARELAERIVHLAEAMNKDMERKKAKDDEDLAIAISLHVDKRRAGLIEVFGWLLVMAFLAREEHGLEIAQKGEVIKQ